MTPFRSMRMASVRTRPIPGKDTLAFDSRECLLKAQTGLRPTLNGIELQETGGPGHLLSAGDPGLARLRRTCPGFHTVYVTKAHRCKNLKL